MTKDEAIAEAESLLGRGVSRSKVCSFINSIEGNELLDHKTCNKLSDALLDDRDSAPYVLQKIIHRLKA